MSALLDELIKIAENSGDPKMIASFESWYAQLTMPPTDDLTDIPAMTEAVVAALDSHWRVATGRYEAGQAFAGDDTAPDGWDEAALLAQMQAAFAAG